MNYQKIYNKIVNRGKLRILESYTEKHHIIPKCMGGSNKKDNIVELTAKEHFICHKLLTEIYPQNNKLIYAFWAMCNQKGKGQSDRYIPTSRTYEIAKLLFSSIQKGIPKTEKHKLALRGKKSEQHRLALQKQKSILICPNCNKEGRGGNMYRHHFDNCGRDLKEVLGVDWYLKNKLNQPKRREVNQYTLSGEFIKTWDSVLSVCKEYSSVVHCLAGKYKTAGGFTWKYNNNEPSNKRKGGQIKK